MLVLDTVDAIQEDLPWHLSVIVFSDAQIESPRASEKEETRPGAAAVG